MAEKKPPIWIERPRISRSTWNNLRSHILSRQRKKNELEKNAENERQKQLEKEQKKEQEARCLEDTKTQIVQLENNLKSLKKEKDELFNQLKKVLNEEEIRRQSKKENQTPQPTMYMQSTARPHGSLDMNPNQQFISAQPQDLPVSKISTPYYRNALHLGPSTSYYPATTGYASTPTMAHPYYTSHAWNGSIVASMDNRQPHEQDNFHLSQAASTSKGQKSVYNNQTIQHSQSLSLSSITTSNTTSLGSSNSIETQFESSKNQPENFKSQYKNPSQGQKNVYNGQTNQYSQSLSLSSITTSNSTSLGSSNSIEIPFESSENQTGYIKSQHENLPVTGSHYGLHNPAFP